MLENLLNEIDAEIARLKQARDLLSRATAPPKRGRPGNKADSSATKKTKRHMSAAIRERMRQAQVQRWARKKSARKSAE